MTFKPGDTVTMTSWGQLRSGVVEWVGRRIVFVRDTHSHRLNWWFPESLTLTGGA